MGWYHPIHLRLLLLCSFHIPAISNLLCLYLQSCARTCTASSRPLVFGHKGAMERQEPLNDVLKFALRRKDGSSEVEGAVSLLEARARDRGDPSCLKQLEAIEHVRRLSSRPGGCHGSGGECDLREGIHGTFRLL